MKRILVFANGEAPRNTKLALPDFDLVYCADGGARVAHALGLKIDLIVGDLDSLGLSDAQKFEASGTVIQRYPSDKVQTDLELCLIEASKENPSEIVLLSATGGRFDHHIANLFLLTRPEFQNISFRVIAQDHELFLLRSKQSKEIAGYKGQTFSLLPLSTEVRGLSVLGARWPLKNATASLGDGRTISNEFDDNRVQIAIEQGMLFVVVVTE